MFDNITAKMYASEAWVVVFLHEMVVLCRTTEGIDMTVGTPTSPDSRERAGRNVACLAWFRRRQHEPLHVSRVWTLRALSGRNDLSIFQHYIDALERNWIETRSGIRGSYIEQILGRTSLHACSVGVSADLPAGARCNERAFRSRNTHVQVCIFRRRPEKMVSSKPVNPSPCTIHCTAIEINACSARSSGAL
jgi:hypothetical protein